jgi:uncharacterized membrane protein
VVNIKINRRQLIQDMVLAVLVIAYTAGTALASRHTSYYDVYKLSGNDSVSFEKAVVLSIDEQKIQHHPVQKGMITGYQNITIRILTGKNTGRIIPIINYLNYDASYLLKTGSRIIVSVNSTASGKTIHVFVNSPDRFRVLALFTIIIMLLLCIAGGQQGFRSVLAIIFTLSSILFVFVPLVCRGIPPALTAVILAAVVASVTLPLTGGIGKKTIAAILGTLACVCLSIVIQSLFCHFASISGFTFGDTDSLMQIAAHSHLKIGSLLFAAVLISSLGAVMDIAMSIASAVNEIHMQNTSAGFKELFTSGMHMGCDMMGTMANTLILAFTGSSLIMLIQIYTYNMQANQIVNSNEIVVEIIQSLTGCFAVISSVPVVSAITAQIMSKKQIA